MFLPPLKSNLSTVVAASNYSTGALPPELDPADAQAATFGMMAIALQIE
ncbi:MAG: hypothetical protein MO846_12190 [Candidatus Devosia symbiotica]|nr:hypothetical protein [Candidatus Devosia symbiotica]